MKNRFLKLTLLMAFVVLQAGFLVKAASADPDQLVSEGKIELLENKNPQAALEKFSQALSESPNHKKANLWYGITVVYDNVDFFGRKSPYQAGLLQDFGLLDESKNFRKDAEGDSINSDLAAVENITIDNTSADFTGSWTTRNEGSGFNPYSSDCRYTMNSAGGASIATWHVNIAVPGTYSVRFWNVVDANNADYAQYTINHAGGSTTNNYAWQRGRNGWASLGNYKFNAGETTIVLSNNSTFAGRINADALRLEYTGTVIDDSEAAFSHSANWQQGLGGGVGDGNYHWFDIDPSESASATWVINLPNPGRYAVTAFITSEYFIAGKTTTAEYTISPNGGTPETVVIDQSHSRWAELGIYDFPNTSGNTITLKSSAEGKTMADSITLHLLKTIPDATAMQAKFNNLVGEMDIALEKFNLVLGYPGFSDTLIIDQGTPSEETIYIDWADVKGLGAYFNFLKAKLNLDAAYDMDNSDVQKWTAKPSLDPLDIFDFYTNLFKPADHAEDYLSAAKDAYKAYLNAYLAGSDFIRNTRSDNNTHLHMFRFYEVAPTQEDKDGALALEAESRDIVNNILANLDDHDNYPSVNIPLAKLFSFAQKLEGVPPPWGGINLDFNAIFSPLNMRSFIMELMQSDYIYENFPDPTFGGLFPDFAPQDWNFMMGKGADLKTPNTFWQDGLPSVELKWFLPSDTAHVTKYEIYSDTTPNVNTSSHLVTTVTNSATSSFLHDTVGLKGAYYYRIYTYFDFGVNQKAIAYSNARKAVIRVKDDCLIDFGTAYGIWVKNNHGNWSQMHNLSPDAIVTADLNGNGKDEAIISFPGHGIWIKNDDGTWVQVHPINPDQIVVGDLDGDRKHDLIIDFGSSYGIWVKYGTGNWAQLHNLSPKSMVVADLDHNNKDDLVVDFGNPYGIWVYYNNSNWSQLHNLSAKSMTVNQRADIIIDFGNPYGIWKYNTYGGHNGWEWIHNLTADSIVCANLDGDGEGADEIITDFGTDYGIWIYYNNSVWKQLHGTSPESMAIGDLDRNGQEDLIIDFGSPYGIWTYTDNYLWNQLHNVSPDFVVTGDLDGI